MGKKANVPQASAGIQKKALSREVAVPICVMLSVKCYVQVE